jgi:hypothetical protein
MVFLISQKNGCTYTLAPDDGELMYAPMYADGSYETALAGYDYVDWECFDVFNDRDILEEADRCFKLLTTETN